MSSYGDLNLDLTLNSNGNIYLVFKGKRISVLDSNGNLNVKIKNIIKSGTPGTDSDNGIYYDGNNVYIKFGNTIKNITGQQNSSQLPQGSIIRFKGKKDDTLPTGWHYYGDTDMSGVIYIINMDGETYTVSEVKLSWNPDLISTSLHDLGFILPTLQKQNPGNVPLSIEYSSDNPLVATIDGNGNITLKSAGSAKIEAITYANSLHNMSQASYTLTINKDEISAFFAQSSKTITVGESFTPSIIFKLNNLVYNGSVGDYYFTSNNSNAVLINGTNITGKGKGTAKIKIHLNLNNWHDSFVSPDNSVLTLTVKSNEATVVPVSSITVSPSSFEVLSGGTQLFSASILPSNATNKTITWSIVSGNATINLNGLLTAGSVTLDSTVIIKATANNGISKTSTGTIKANSLPLPQDDELLYTVGLISDIHYATRKGLNRPITTDRDGNGSENTSGKTYSLYKLDLNYLIRNPFKNADFIASSGDIAEYNINDFIKFTEDYKAAYNNSPKPFYCATGNHDHGLIYCLGNGRVQSNGAEIGNNDGSRWNSITYGETTYQCPGSLATTISGLSKSDFYSGSKSYYISYKGDMYIFMMADYGSTNGKSDVHPHNMISSPQITTLKSKISNYTFPDNESNLNFLYYNYEDLIKLEELLRTNSSKRIFIFSHYFFPHKAGGGNKYQPGQSTELMGITFHFLNYLNNKYKKNTIWFSGHSHISWLDNTVKGLHWTNTNYDYIKPTSGDNNSMAYNENFGLYEISGTNKIYNRDYSNKLDNNPTGWNIHLPSMSRPENNGTLLNNCEAAIMRVYTNKVEIEKLGYTTSDGENYLPYSNISDKILTIYNDGSGTCNDTAPEISSSVIDENSLDPVPNTGIRFIIRNKSNDTAVFTGKFKLSIGDKNEIDWSTLQGDCYEAPFMFRGNTERNTEELKPGEALALTFPKGPVDISSSGVAEAKGWGTIKFDGTHFICTRDHPSHTEWLNWYVNNNIANGTTKPEKDMNNYGRVVKIGVDGTYYSSSKSTWADHSTLHNVFIIDSTVNLNNPVLKGGTYYIDIKNVIHVVRSADGDANKNWKKFIVNSVNPNDRVYFDEGLVKVLYLTSSSSNLFNINPSNISISSTGGSKNVAITSNNSWTANSDSSWCTITPTSGQGNNNLTITVAENSGNTNRTARISVTSNNSTLTITVNQSANGGSSVDTEGITIGGKKWARWNVGTSSSQEIGTIYKNYPSSIPSEWSSNGWRIPTRDDYFSLLSNTQSITDLGLTINNSLFFPVYNKRESDNKLRGRYWTSSNINSGGIDSQYTLYICSDENVANANISSPDLSDLNLMLRLVKDN